MIRLHASALPRIMECIGSVGLAPPMPPEAESEQQREGTAAHFVAEWAIRERSFDGLPDAAPNGYAIDAEMREHAMGYAATIPDFAKDDAPPVWIEQTCDWFALKDVEIATRVDAAWYVAERDTLHVRDYKYGFRIVEPDYNWQLIAGAVGLIRKLGAQGAITTPPRYICMGVFQPRPYHAEGAL